MENSEQPGASSFPLTKNIPNQKDANAVGRARITRGYSGQGNPLGFWTYMKWTMATLLCLMCMAVGAITGDFYWRSGTVRTVFSQMIEHPWTTLTQRDPLATFKPDLQFPVYHQNTVNVLVLGADKDFVPGKPIPIKDSNGRSDAILLARIDFARQAINVVSIPRDLAVRIPERGRHKINAAHAMGGPELTKETIKHVFGVDVDYYATLDFDGFKKVVDAVGGVTVNVEKKLDYDDNWGNLHIHLKPGVQHLDGYEAMGYVRMRHSDNDMERSRRQQGFLQALRAQVQDPKNFTKLPKVLEAIETSLKSNMTHAQLLTLGNFARELPPDSIHLETLPVIEGPSYVYARRADSAELIRRVFFDNDPTMMVTINALERGEVAYNASNRRRRRGGRRVRAAAVRTVTPPVEEMDTLTDDSAELTAPEETSPDSSASSGSDGSAAGSDTSGEGSSGRSRRSRSAESAPAPTPEPPAAPEPSSGSEGIETSEG